MRTTLAFCLVFLALGCGESPPADGPADALRSMLALAKAGDWGAYVDTWYGEKHKFTSPTDRDQVVKRFEEKWGAKVIPALEAASKVEPRIEGDKALFERDGTVLFQLFRDADGSWTFHL